MPVRQSKPYRVRVEAFVLVNAHNVEFAKANAEVALRKAVIKSYESTNDSEARMWGDGWQAYGFLAKSAMVWGDGE